jgi:hypothetical protein
MSMDDGAPIDGGSAYADDPAKQNGSPEDNTSKENHTSPTEKPNIQKDLLKPDNSSPGNSAPQVNGTLEQYTALSESDTLAKKGATAENGSAEEHDTLRGNEATEQVGTTNADYDAPFLTDSINGTVWYQGNAEQFGIVAETRSRQLLRNQRRGT